MRNLFTLLSDPDRGEKALELMHKRLAFYAKSFRGIIAHPYVALAHRVVEHTEQLLESAGKGDRERMKEIGHKIRRLLRRMRLIRHLETRVIAPLAFYVNRVALKDRSAMHASPEKFRARLQETVARVEAFKSRDMEDAFKSTLLPILHASREAFTIGRYVDAKEHIKIAVALLASSTVGSDTMMVA